MVTDERTQSTQANESDNESGAGWVRRKKTVPVWILGFFLVFALAAGVRVYSIWNGPAEFEPVRQYYTALIARSLYYGEKEDISEKQREFIKNATPTIHEPPITEWLSVRIFKVLGEENLWVPRLIASLGWLVGGMFLWLLLRRLVGPGAALIGASFWLLVPFGIRQSMSFQPDALALGLTMAALLFLLTYHQRPSTGRLLIAALFAAAAIMTKAQMVFLLGAAYAALGMRRMPFYRFFGDRDSWLFAVIALVPSAVYILYNLIVMEGITAQRGIIPESLLSPQFYLAWLYNIDKVLGYPLFALSLFGVVLLRGDARFLALGLWAGYVLLGLVFTYHFATHTYYHASILPAAALGIAGLAAPLMAALARQDRAYAIASAGLVGLMILVLTLGPVLRSLGDKGIEAMVATYREVGERVGRSNRVIMLARAEGLPLMYHGWVSGWLWPTNYHRAVEQVGLRGLVQGRPSSTVLDTDEVDRRFSALRSGDPEYFVVTFLEDYRGQPAIDSYLSAHYPLFARTDRYIIYDLRVGKQGGDDNEQE